MPRFLSIRHLKVITLAASVNVVCGCADYYVKTQEFQTKFENRDYQSALNYLKDNRKLANSRERVLYDLNMGTSAYLTQDYNLSIEHFGAADYYIEDYRKTIGNEILALVTNPRSKPYMPEYFEQVLLHYYQALNYIALSDYEGALVECRRMNLQLQKINDATKGKQNKYSNDAFGHYLMGIVYEASGDANNAFIAYRNAVKHYEQYSELFGYQAIPAQLLADVVRSARQNGFVEESDFFENKYNAKFEPRPSGYGEVVVFVHNGLGPVKRQSSFNFVSTLNNGFVTFTDADNAVTFPIFIGSNNYEENALKDLNVVRVAFPKYVERPLASSTVDVTCCGEKHEAELVEDVNAIAFKSLEDRCMKEIGSTILRIALKQSLKKVASEKNDYIGLFVGIANAITETADTRNWQTLPHSIYMSRLVLPEGRQKIRITSGQSAVEMEVEVKAGKVAIVQTEV